MLPAGAAGSSVLPKEAISFQSLVSRFSRQSLGPPPPGTTGESSTMASRRRGTAAVETYLVANVYPSTLGNAAA